MGKTKLSAETWTVDRIEVLRRMHNAGKSARAIAEELGGFFTRSSVNSKLHRLGLIPGSRVVSEAAKSGTVGATAYGIIHRIKAKQNGTGAPDALLKLRPDADVHPRHIGFNELTKSSCRWPYGDRPFTFCGCEKMPTGPYCYAHDVLSKPVPQQQITAPRRAA
jgi:hypothetical protein